MEKSQSMLFRFRESQAAELGLASRQDKRPRAAITCKDLRSCERWRGEILREISRKVSKIQDVNLGDYETRDLNDQINNSLREKNHWETQIIALGGANYKRAAGKTMDADGKEVPGARGYKYFGRARELPGVKELFSNAAAEEALNTSHLDTAASLFVNPGPGYYGELDDDDAELLAFEREAEQEAWDESIETLVEETSLTFVTPPLLPLPVYISLDASTSAAPVVPEEAVEEATGSKRKASTSAASKAKKAKLSAAAAAAAAKEEAARQAELAKSGNSFLSVLNVEDLRPPKLMTPKEMEAYIVAAQKQELLRVYAAEDE